MTAAHLIFFFFNAAAPGGGTPEATGYTVTAPDPTGGFVDAESAAFTVAIPNGTTLSSPVAVTPAATGCTFTPPAVTLSGDDATGTFTINASAAGNKTVSFTNDGGLTDPANVEYVALVGSGGGVVNIRIEETEVRIR